MTFFGPGAQGTTWEFMLGINLALALCFFAGFLALGERHDLRTAVAIAALLVFACTADSGVAAFGSVFAGLVVVLLWPWRMWLVTLLPALLVHGLWFLFGDTGPTTSAARRTMWTFAWRLFALSTGGLVGGGETPSRVGGPPESGTLPISGVQVGLIVLVVAGACIGFGLLRHKLERRVVVNLVAGLAAAVVTVAVLARTRAFLIPPSLFPGSRYVQWVGTFLMVALAPAITAALRPAEARTRRWLTIAAGVGLVAVFAINTVPLDATRDFQAGWSAGTEAGVRQAVELVDHRVPRRPPPRRRRAPDHAQPTDRHHARPGPADRRVIDTVLRREAAGLRGERRLHPPQRVTTGILAR